jgi:hypothetical protein
MRLLYGVNGEGMGHATRSHAGTSPRPPTSCDEGEIRRLATVLDEWHFDVVITHFEPLSGASRSTHTPLICVDSINVIDA